MIAYIIKSTLCLLVLLLVYHIFLERETMHRFNRFFLLFSLIFGLTIPLLTINIGEPVQLFDQISEINSRLDQKETTQPVPAPAITPGTDQITAPSESSSDGFWLLAVFYLAGCILMAGRFSKNLYSIYSQIRNNPHTRCNSKTLVLTNNDSKPHSFFNYIFVHRALYQSGQIDESILQHEYCHARQKHSLDILFIELVKIAFWFNPIIYFYKSAIQTNHEYLADSFVIAGSDDTISYQRLLLKMKSTTGNVPLASSITFSSTKKRIIMMSKNSSRWITSGKKMALIPLLAALIFTFSTRTTTAQTVQQMSLTELIDAVSERMDAMDSLSDQEQQQLRGLMEKMQEKLQPEKPAPPKKLKEQNVLQVLVNKEGLILINEEPVPLDKVASKVTEFINNNGSDPELSESPEKAVVSFKMAEETPMGTYTDVMGEIRKAQPARINFHSPKHNPPAPPKPAEKLSERNILRILINKEGLVLANEEPVPIDNLDGKITEFVTNNGADPNLSDSPENAIISIKPAPETPRELITDIQHEIRDAYTQIRNQAAQSEYGVDFDKLENESAARNKIGKKYSMRISYSEGEG